MRKGLSAAALALLLVLDARPYRRRPARRRHRLRPVRLQGVPDAVPQRHEPHGQGPQDPDRPARPPPAERDARQQGRQADRGRPTTTATTASAPARRSSCASRASTRSARSSARGSSRSPTSGQSFAKRAGVVVINARTRKRQLIYAELDANAKRASDKMLLIHPGENFDEGARYIVALRGPAHRLGQADQGRARASARSRAASARSGCASATRASSRRSSAPASRKSNLTLAWDFTVASEKGLTSRMLHIRDDAFAQLGDRNLADGKVEGNAPQFAVTKVVEAPTRGSCAASPARSRCRAT